MQMSTSSPVLNILVAPDSFKGSLTAAAAADYIARGVSRALPLCNVSQMPIADGGEGTARAIATALGGKWGSVDVPDANGTTIAMPFAACESPQIGRFAVFDVAEVVGLPDAVLPPGARTTRGVGQAIRGLRELGHRTIVVGLGGSSTMDAGAGMLAELALNIGAADGSTLFPTYDTLPQVARISRRADCAWLDQIRLIGLSDVSSPLTGPNGASHVFGAQKGFTELEKADQMIGAFGSLCEFSVAQQVAHLPGAGTAGGLGFGLLLLGAELIPGADFIVEATGVESSISSYDWIITGEGRSDRQTLMGKGPALIAELAREHAIPVSLLSGAVEAIDDLDRAFDGCFSVMDKPESLQYAMEHAGKLLENAGFRLARLFSAALFAGVQIGRRQKAAR
jgi:glycerate kinase